MMSEKVRKQGRIPGYIFVLAAALSAMSLPTPPRQSSNSKRVCRMELENETGGQNSTKVLVRTPVLKNVRLMEVRIYKRGTDR